MPDEAAEPHVYVAAFLCQDVINEIANKGTRHLTAFRITSAFSVSPILLPETDLGEEGGRFSAQLVFPTLQLHALIILNSEKPTIEFDVRIKAFDPNGIELQQTAQAIKCRLKGGAEGHILNLVINLRADTPGDCWVEVHVRGILATKIPMRIVHEMPRAMIMRTKDDTHQSEQSQPPSTGVSE
jgi:hypothetical protein